jgi:hypothetical protein
MAPCDSPPVIAGGSNLRAQAGCVRVRRGAAVARAVFVSVLRAVVMRVAMDRAIRMHVLMSVMRGGTVDFHFALTAAAGRTHFRVPFRSNALPRPRRHAIPISFTRISSPCSTCNW